MTLGKMPVCVIVMNPPPFLFSQVKYSRATNMKMNYDVANGNHLSVCSLPTCLFVCLFLLQAACFHVYIDVGVPPINVY